MSLVPRARGRLSTELFLIISVASVLVGAIALLIYVGLGDADRTYRKIKFDQVAAQGVILQKDINSFLHTGLPIEQFPGFDKRMKSITGESSPIMAVTAIDLAGTVVFPRGEALALVDTGWVPHSLNDPVLGYSILQNDVFFRIVFPLIGVEGNLGELRLDMPRNAVDSRLEKHFRPVFLISVLMVLLSTALIYPVKRFTGGRGLKILCTFAFVSLAVVLVVVLVRLYTEGIQEKTDALAGALAQRVEAATGLGLPIDSFSGLDGLFLEYKSLYPEISGIALVEHDRVLVSSSSGRVGLSFLTQQDTLDTSVQIRTANSSALQLHMLHVIVPKSVIWAKLWRSVKNFFVLFLASAFFAVIFLNLVTSLTRKKDFDPQGLNLQRIAPVYFLTVFVFALNVSFLPEFLTDLALKSQAASQLVPAVFTTFFAAFGLILIPAGRFAETYGIKNLLLIGMLCICMAMGLMAFSPQLGFAMTFPIRALEGVGQGILFIGTQTYILANAPGKKTEGVSLMVTGFSGGMIAGTAIGSLLIMSLTAVEVFWLGTSISLVAFFLIVGLISSKESASGVTAEGEEELVEADSVLDCRRGETSRDRFFHLVIKGVRDPGFFVTTLFMGIPTKIIYTGVTIFALPLVLAEQGYLLEDIGQLLVLYGIGTLIVSKYISRFIDSGMKPDRLLLAGCIIGGVGLLLIGIGLEVDVIQGMALLAAIPASPLSIAFLVLGLLTLGIGHGFIHAPVVTQITHTRAATILGQTTATTVYRVLERFGHLLGPIILGALLVMFGASMSIVYLAMATVVAGIFFAGGQLIAQRAAKTGGCK